MHNEIYKISSKEELRAFENSNNYLVLSKLLKYYNMLDDYESINRIVNRDDFDINSGNLKNLINYYRCLLANKNKNDYVKEKLLYILPDDYKIRFNIENERNIYDLATIFEKSIKTNWYKWLKKDKFLTYKMYFVYYFQNKSVISKLEKHMKKNFIKLIKQERITFEELDYLIFIIDLYRKLYIVNIENIDFITVIDKKLSEIKKASDLALKSIKDYEKIIGNKKKLYVDTVCNFLRLYIGRVEDEKKIKECIEILNKYKYINIHYSFLNIISKTNPKDYDEKIFIDEIKRIIDSHDQESISAVISLYSAKRIDKEKQESFIKKLEEIKSKNISESYKKEILIGIEEYKFWNGEKFDLSLLDGLYNVNPFLKYLIKYDNGIISYDEFLDSINKIGKIDSLFINNWERVEKIFKNNNIDWLITIIINLNDISTHDYNLLNMLHKKFINILQKDETGMFLYDFSRLESAVSCIDNDFHFCYYSSLIYITRFNVFDENCFHLVDLTLKYDLPKRSKDNNSYDIIKNYIYNVTQAMIIHSRYDILKDILIFSKDYLSKEDYITIYSVTLFGNKEIMQKIYFECLIYLDKVFKNSSEIQEDNYKMIACIVGKIILGEMSSKLDISNNLVLDTTEEESKKYNKILLNIYNENQPSDDDKDESSISILLQKIYFKYIEKFNAGKIIKINTNASGEEIIKELASIVGRDSLLETQKKVYDGLRLTQPWLNILQIHDIFKTVKKGNNLMFKNTSNKFFILQDYIIQPSSLILLSKLKILSKIEKEKYLSIFNSLVVEIEKLKKYNIVDYAEIYEKSQVAYDELLDECYRFIKKISKEKIVFVSNANVLGFKNIEHINKFDVDVLKQIVITDGNICFITDDPFYLDNNIFKNNFYSTFSYVLSLYFNDIINSNDLYRCAEMLTQMNYNMTVDKSIYRFLLERGNDENIKKVLKIIE